MVPEASCVRGERPGVWVDSNPVILHVCGGDREAGSAQDDPFPSPMSQGPRGPGGVRSLPTERAARLVRWDCWGEQGGGFLLHGLREGRREGGSSYPILPPLPPDSRHQLAAFWTGAGGGPSLAAACSRVRGRTHGQMCMWAACVWNRGPPPHPRLCPDRIQEGRRQEEWAGGDKVASRAQRA